MNRAQLRRVIATAHEALHAGNVEAAHDALHSVGCIGDVDSMTGEPEVEEAAAAFLRYAEGELPCGHQIADLIFTDITKCGACIKEKQS